MSVYIPDELIEQALERSNGRVFVAAQSISCSPATIYGRIASIPRLKELLETKRGRHLDFAEDQLAKKVTEGDLGAIIFTLKTLGRDRGYSTVETAIQINGPVEIREVPGNGWRRPELPAPSIKEDE